MLTCDPQEPLPGAFKDALILLKASLSSIVKSKASWMQSFSAQEQQTMELLAETTLEQALVRVSFRVLSRGTPDQHRSGNLRSATGSVQEH